MVGKVLLGRLYYNYFGFTVSVNITHIFFHALSSGFTVSLLKAVVLWEKFRFTFDI